LFVPTILYAIQIFHRCGFTLFLSNFKLLFEPLRAHYWTKVQYTTISIFAKKVLPGTASGTGVIHSIPKRNVTICEGGNLMMRNAVRSLAGVSAFCFVAACSQTGIRRATLTPAANLPRPDRILVYDFAVSQQEVKEYQGIMRQQPTIKDAAERERLLAQEVKNALAEETVDHLKPLGFVVERVARGTRATGNDLVIDGQFLTVDEGNPLHRLVVGFGTGGSAVQTQVQVYQAPEARKLLEFTTQSDSSKMPGAAATLGAGAVAQGGVTVGMVVANAAVSGVKTYKSDVARMAAASGDQVARYLSEFFAKQGWIRPDQVRKARIVY
jgi:Domain of unknown function (DUF4410)